MVDSPLRKVAAVAPGPELASALADMSLRYLLTSRTALVNPPAFYPYGAKDFLKDYASLIYSDESIAMYRFKSGRGTRQP